MSFVTPVTAGDRQAELVVHTDIDEVARTLEQPSGGVYSLVVNADRYIVTGTRESDRLDPNTMLTSEYLPYRDSEALTQALDGKSGFVAEPAINDSDEADDAGPCVVAYAPVETRDWAVLTHVPKATARNG